ncbi:MAG: single-stranded-DNA-specific exonuclease RecJ [Treponemataceae bacterium]
MEWIKKPIDSSLVKSIMQKYSCDALTASILLRRNIVDGEKALYTLETNSRYLHSPFLFRNMEDAVDRILNAKDEGEKVLVFGDRDVDGITATALLYEALKDLGLDVSWQIPTGDEAYGLSNEAVENFAKRDGTLIITVDCGISNFNEIAFAATFGIDVIVTDHHKPQEKLPNAFTIINPQLEDSGYPIKEISGCVVAWKLVLALRFAMTEFYKNPICLLNVRPINNAYTIEVRKLVNLVEVASVNEHIQEEGVSFTATRLPQFLQGQQIFVWNEALQKKTLKKIFGTGIEFNFFDLQPVLAKKFPELGESSLLRLKDFSTIGKYLPEKNTEIDAFLNIFITFVQATSKLFSDRELQEVQLVSVATIADIMPLYDENRMLLRLGLNAMNKNLRYGLADILARQGLGMQKIGTNDISWSVSPVLNAAGRMGRAEVALEMLIAKNPAERNELVNELFKMNDDRKTLAETCWEQIIDESYKSFDEHNKKLVVIASDKINRGVSGLLASRLVNTFNVPSIVICKMSDGTATASCRSVKGFHILDLLSPSKELFLDYGGHDYAAGFSINNENIPIFFKNLKNASIHIELDSQVEKTLEIDAEIPEAYLNEDILKVVDKFEPFGEGFENLVFMSQNLKLEDAIIVGRTERKHLKLTVKSGNTKWTAMFWGEGDRLESLQGVPEVDLVYNITRNTFNGNVSPQMIVLDLKKS